MPTAQHSSEKIAFFGRLTVNGENMFAAQIEQLVACIKPWKDISRRQHLLIIQTGLIGMLFVFVIFQNIPIPHFGLANPQRSI